MKRYLILTISLIIFGTYCGAAQIAQKTKAPAVVTPLEKLAKKRTQLLKDQLFLSLDQTAQILNINIDMLKKLDILNKQKVDKETYKKQLAQIETTTKNKIVSLLTPAQRDRFETKLFSEVYQTHVDKKKAVSKR
jgi:hypothetical protein